MERTARADDRSAPSRADVSPEESAQLYRALFEKNASIMLLIDPETAAIRDANPRACAFYGYSRDELRSMKITDINALSKEEVFREMSRAKHEQRNHFQFRHRLASGALREVDVFSGPITVKGRSLLCSVIHDVTERNATARERERLINELKNALAEVRTLRGFIPICSSCKKIRDDKGFWSQIEVYLSERSDAQFSHGICPDCAQRLYPDFADDG